MRNHATSSVKSMIDSGWLIYDIPENQPFEYVNRLIDRAGDGNCHIMHLGSHFVDGQIFYTGQLLLSPEGRRNIEPT